MDSHRNWSRGPPWVGQLGYRILSSVLPPSLGLGGRPVRASARCASNRGPRSRPRMGWGETYYPSRAGETVSWPSREIVCLSNNSLSLNRCLLSTSSRFSTSIVKDPRRVLSLFRSLPYPLSCTNFFLCVQLFSSPLCQRHAIKGLSQCASLRRLLNTNTLKHNTITNIGYTRPITNA